MKPGEMDMLEHASITGTIWNGLTVQARNGRPAKLAVIDDAGNVLEAGPAVARECWNIVLQVHRNYLQDQGHLPTHGRIHGSRGLHADVCTPR